MSGLPRIKGAKPWLRNCITFTFGCCCEFEEDEGAQPYVEPPYHRLSASPPPPPVVNRDVSSPLFLTTF